MALVGKVGRRRLRARLALFVVYALLSIGALTTVFPFLLMLTTGFKGPTDQDDDRLIPQYWSVFDSGAAEGIPPKESLLGKYLNDKYGGDWDLVESTRAISMAGPGNPVSEGHGGSIHDMRAIIRSYRNFLGSLPPDDFIAGFRTQIGQVTGRLAERYQSWLVAKYGSIEKLNEAYIEENMGFQTVEPPTEMLDRKGWNAPHDRKTREWIQFKTQLPVEFRIPLRSERMYQQFLRSKYENQFSLVPNEIKRASADFNQLRLPSNGSVLAEFRAQALPERFQNESLEKLWAAIAPVPMPIETEERDFVQAHARAIRTEFALRNYLYVIDYIALNGRALWNTAIFCLLAILLQLIINPLAAYALSRYPIRASAKVLLFLLATMAFPAEVALIPSFLLLKQLNLLNTFAALVLPGAASGYMIFLLKGFFDSLPTELFEAGQLDGARESTMMLKIALPLSKPVLGYLSLLAFMGAYGSFMFAFLVAQDQRIWTLMVWIYNLQTFAPKAVTMAALTVAAAPTFVVFLFAQKVIMEGIILPGER